MASQGKFDDKAQTGFLKLLGKEAGRESMLDEQQWADWMQILRDLVASPDEVISADALLVLGGLYDTHPERMAEPTAEGIQEMQLGKLVAAKSAQAQQNLINYIFTVMLSSDRATRDKISELSKTVEEN